MHSNPAADESHMELIDGSVVAIRELDSGDSEDVVGLYEELPADERYYRFFTMRPVDLTTSARLLTEHSDSQYALGAFDSGKLLGVAHYVAYGTAGDAEVAVVVAHDQHLRGVGTALLGRLGQIAKRNGLHHLVADVLVENNLMLKVITDAGWPCRRKRDGAVLHVEIDLDAAHA